MAFDGITTAALCDELNRKLSGGHIAKIIQPEPCEIILTIKNNAAAWRVLLSADATLPLACLITDQRTAPMTAPNFCMLLRKHLAGGKLIDVTQPSLERILVFRIRHNDELGDSREWKLILELMGKHSNLILVDDKGVITDAIKKISFNVSSVREVLPGRTYFIPQTQNKADPLTSDEEVFLSSVFRVSRPLYKALYESFTGLSPVMAEENCYRAGADPDDDASLADEPLKTHLYHIFQLMMDDVRSRNFQPAVYIRDGEPVEFSCLPLTMFHQLESRSFTSVSSLLTDYYAEKELRTRIRQRSSDLRRIVSTALERNGRTLALQEKQMHDTEKKDKYRIYGELLNTYGYDLAPAARELKAVNYYTNEPVTVPLDPQLTPAENAKKYFDRYTRLKRTAEALTERIRNTEEDVRHLESIAESLDTARDEADLDEIRAELVEYGYIRKNGASGKKRSQKARPLHFISSDGFDIYVGKNNYQNEEVTFHMARPDDWWFHANDIPGSHVIVRGEGKELPDRTFEEAGRLAAHFSKAHNAPKVEIDYTLRKNLKKPTGGRPGFVVYHTNYSMMAPTDISGIREADET
ncbi:MAG: Rqc2 family fibronectin-binding protein [Bilifractor sp.]|jgi:predicted ribosome quality control (RQC) complex YloA/Tae2 family protein